MNVSNYVFINMKLTLLLSKGKITSCDLLFYWELQRSFHNGVIDVSLRKIASAINGYSSTMVHRYIKKLVNVGLLEETGKRGLVSIYKIKKVGCE